MLPNKFALVQNILIPVYAACLSPACGQTGQAGVQPYNYSIKYSLENAFLVSLIIYNIPGSEISSDIYLFRLEAGSFVSTKKFLFLK
jgi:hypothetical protein